MLNILYRNWAKGCFAGAFFLFIILFSTSQQFDKVLFLIWLQVPIYLMHEFEEHVFPGGFKEFINIKLFHSTTPDFPLSAAGVFWINVPLIWIMFPLFAVLAQHVDLRLGVVLPCLALFNATTHIIAALIKRCYNPGLIISVLVNYPSGIYTLHIMSQQGLFDGKTQLLGWGIAILAHISMVGGVLLTYKRKSRL